MDLVKRTRLAWLAMLSMSLAAHAAERQPVVVELFTSQGCSSCPPAEAFLGELAQRPDVIALAYHVQYWDDLGWRDRFGIAAADKRQEKYGRSLGLSGVFTPQMIVNGRHSVVGTDRREVLGEITKAGAAQASVAATVVDGQLVVTVPMRTDVRGYELSVVSYLPRASTAIARGENSGRTLAEFNIVRESRKLGAVDGSAQRFNVAIASLPEDATNAAVLLQAPGQGRIAGAAIVTLR